MTGEVCWICGNAHSPTEQCGATLDPRIGSVLSEKYAVKREIGAGGMGKVYEGQHIHIGRRVAIKFLLSEYAAHPEILRRFENEARAAGSLEHENIAAVIDFDQAADGARYLVMEYLSGQDCEKLLAKEGPLPVARVVNIVLQVCRGLDVAHRAGIVHRDLKPANVFLVTRPDRTELAKILDFGIAKLRKTEDQPGTATGMTLGTPHYMSPEQARGEKDVDHRTDVYALGVILYELLSGNKPHGGNSFLEIINSILHKDPPPLDTLCAGLPAKLVEVIHKAMHVDLTRRFASVADLGQALIPFAAGRVVPFHSEPLGVAVAEAGEQTLASGTASAESSASTTAPVTPRTQARYRSRAGFGKFRWFLVLALLAAITSIALLEKLRWSRVEPSVAKAASVSVPLQTSAATSSIAPPPNALPSVANSLSGHRDRPGSGVTSQSSTPPRAPKPAAPPLPPARTTVRGEIDISREPNF